jgi:hypothetical protein
MPAIWHDPGDIKSKDLLNGPGGEKHHPQLPVKFLKEDNTGRIPSSTLRTRMGRSGKLPPRSSFLMLKMQQHRMTTAYGDQPAKCNKGVSRGRMGIEPPQRSL